MESPSSGLMSTLSSHNHGLSENGYISNTSRIVSFQMKPFSPWLWKRMLWMNIRKAWRGSDEWSDGNSMVSSRWMTTFSLKVGQFCCRFWCGICLPCPREPFIPQAIHATNRIFTPKNSKQPVFLWLFQLDDEPNHYIKNGLFRIPGLYDMVDFL